MDFGYTVSVSGVATSRAPKLLRIARSALSATDHSLRLARTSIETMWFVDASTLALTSTTSPCSMSAVTSARTPLTSGATATSHSYQTVPSSAFLDRLADHARSVSYAPRDVATAFATRSTRTGTAMECRTPLTRD